MHSDELRILELFRKNKGRDLSTSKIISNLHPKEFSDINKGISPIFKDKDKISEFKRKKAQLHRKTLYHLNKLVRDGLLKMSKVTGKGQKHFTLLIGTDEDIIFEKTKHRSIIITKPQMPAMPIEGYEQKNIIKKFDEATWISRVNSSLILCKGLQNIERLKKIIKESFSYINDVIGVNDFEILVEKSNSAELENFLIFVEQECSDYGKMVSFTLDFTNISNSTRIGDFIELFARINPMNMNIIFDVESKELQINEELMERAVEHFSREKIQLYIKNQNCHDAPYILGKAGPYTFSKNDWALYRDEYGSKMTSIICAQSTISVDVKQFFEQNNNINQFRELITNITKSLLYTNSIQRSRSGEYFNYLIELNNPHTRNLFSYSRNYIRFWNYGWKDKETDPSLVLDLIKSTKEITDQFCRSEETIYKACGMPTRFKVSFSCAFKDSTKEEFSRIRFKKLHVRKLEHLYEQEIKDIVFEKEKIFSMFDGGDRLRFYRGGEFNPREVVREIMIMLNTYEIPFFCYDFGNVRDSVTLNQYMQDD